MWREKEDGHLSTKNRKRLEAWGGLETRRLGLLPLSEIYNNLWAASRDVDASLKNMA